MNEIIKNILPACITAIITVVGFIVTYFLNKRNFKEEVNRQKVNIHLDKIADLPFKIQSLLDTILEKKGNAPTLLPLFRELMQSIFAYGTKEAISLVTNLQELNYLVASNPESMDKQKVIAYYILLLCQVKYDLTGIEINPEYWYRMRLTDYAKTKSSLNGATNEIVKKLDLKSFLHISE